MITQPLFAGQSAPKGIAGKDSCVLDTHLMRVFRLKKSVMTTARLVNDRLKAEKIRWVPLMFTLTYKNVDDWRPDHISDFTNRVRKYAARRGYKFPIVWVMELQKRGAPHYHCLIWIPARLRLPHADRQGWWNFGTTNVVRVRNAVGYVAKYASKFESKDCEFPKGARIHGVGGITKQEARIVNWWKLPKALRTGDEGSCRWTRSPGGGWQNKETGERVAPLWKITEGIWSANLVFIDRKNPDEQELIKKRLYVEARQQTVKEYKQCGLRRFPQDQEHKQSKNERNADLRWRADLNRQERLVELNSENLLGYWRFFERVEVGHLVF